MRFIFFTLVTTIIGFARASTDEKTSFETTPQAAEDAAIAPGIHAFGILSNWLIGFGSGQAIQGTWDQRGQNSLSENWDR